MLIVAAVLGSSLSSLRALMVPLTFFVLSFSLACCTEAVQLVHLSLRRNQSQYRYTFNVFLGSE